MSKWLIVFSLFFCGTLDASENTAKTLIDSIEARDSGFHSLFLETTIPDQGCDRLDRAVIDISTDGGKSLLSVALAAISSGAQVVIRVDGCVTYQPSAHQGTAPKVSKVLVYR